MNTLEKKKKQLLNHQRGSSQPPSFFGHRPRSIYDFMSLINIGNGAFANVYKGFERVPNSLQEQFREVAIKRINLSAITDPAIYKTTLNEVKVFQSLDHPNIVKCFSSFEETSRVSRNKYLVIVLEYVNGGDLQNWIQHCAISQWTLIAEPDIWYIFCQVAVAVDFIHSKHIIHRDLKPANVLLSTNLHVKLSDFGLSRLYTAPESKAQTVCGTPYYMSPERIVEDSYTFNSDIWSLGCVLYEMAALKSPFFGEKENVKSLIQKIRSAEFPPLPDDRYSPQLEFLINSCMDPVMDKRPTANEVYRAAEHMDRLCREHTMKSRSKMVDADKNGNALNINNGRGNNSV